MRRLGAWQEVRLSAVPESFPRFKKTLLDEIGKKKVLFKSFFISSALTNFPALALTLPKRRNRLNSASLKMAVK